MQRSSRMVFAALPVVFLLGHAGSIAFAGDKGPAASFFWLIAAPVIASAACLWRSYRDGSEGWLPVSAAMLFWASGMAATMVATVFFDNVNEDRLSMLLYVLYGVPLIFALASPEDERWSVRLVDGLLAAALGYLYYIHVTTLIAAAANSDQTVRALQVMFDIENLYIALFAVIRFAARNRGRAEFFRAVAVYAVCYLLCAAYINHFEADGAYGRWPDLLIDLPFLVLSWHALGAGYRQGLGEAHNAHIRARIVRAGGPLLIPASLLSVSVLLVTHSPLIAVAGCVAASLGYGLRTMLVQIRNLEEQDELSRLSHVDALTGIPNRRRFDEVLAHEWLRRCQTSGQLALLMIDIDHFKQLNDQFGHAVGDDRLRSVAAVLAGCARREADLVARYGGEEFAAILSGIEPPEAAMIAERMRASVEALCLASGAGTGIVTVSIGMACATASDTDMAAFVTAADTALYEAKRNGRNRVSRRTAARLRAVKTPPASNDGRAA